MKRTTLSFLIAFCLLSGIVIAPPQTHAADIIVAPLGYFDPSYTYLDQGNNSITDNGDQTATVKVSTTAKQQVSYIGANIYLDRWTGSSWFQVGSYTASESDAMYSNAFATFIIISGYYYRTRTVHWTSHSGVYEQGTIVSSAILAI